MNFTFHTNVKLYVSLCPSTLGHITNIALDYSTGYYGYYRTLVGNRMLDVEPLVNVTIQSPKVAEAATKPSPRHFTSVRQVAAQSICGIRPRRAAISALGRISFR